VAAVRVVSREKYATVKYIPNVILNWNGFHGKQNSFVPRETLLFRMIQ
jgi:hypothetical protein